MILCILLSSYSPLWLSQGYYHLLTHRPPSNYLPHASLTVNIFPSNQGRTALARSQFSSLPVHDSCWSAWLSHITYLPPSHTSLTVHPLASERKQSVNTSPGFNPYSTITSYTMTIFALLRVQSTITSTFNTNHCNAHDQEVQWGGKTVVIHELKKFRK